MRFRSLISVFLGRRLLEEYDHSVNDSWILNPCSGATWKLACLLWQLFFYPARWYFARTRPGGTPSQAEPSWDAMRNHDNARAFINNVLIRHAVKKGKKIKKKKKEKRKKEKRQRVQCFAFSFANGGENGEFQRLRCENVFNRKSETSPVKTRDSSRLFLWIQARPGLGIEAYKGKKKIPLVRVPCNATPVSKRSRASFLQATIVTYDPSRPRASNSGHLSFVNRSFEVVVPSRGFLVRGFLDRASFRTHAHCLSLRLPRDNYRWLAERNRSPTGEERDSGRCSREKYEALGW